jgi:hypothetical protein
MKLKIQISEGFHTWIVKNPIEIDTDNYPVLSGMSQDEVLDYLRENNSDIPFYDGDDTSDEWTLHDELMSQENELVKEKNYETDILLGE